MTSIGGAVDGGRDGLVVAHLNWSGRQERLPVQIFELLEFASGMEPIGNYGFVVGLQDLRT